MQESFVKIPKSLVDELSLIVNEMKERQESVRQKIIEDSAHQNVSATYALELLATQRWLEHLVYILNGLQFCWVILIRALSMRNWLNAEMWLKARTGNNTKRVGKSRLESFVINQHHKSLNINF